MNAIHTELAHRIDRRNRSENTTTQINASSIWVFAGALLLPPFLASVTAAFAYAHLGLRVWRPVDDPPRRTTLLATLAFASTAGVTALLVQAFSELNTGGTWSPGSLLIILIAMVTFNLLDCLTVGTIQYLRIGWRGWAALLGSAVDNALEVATQCLGAILAVILTTRPVLVVLLILPMLVLHRAILINQLEKKASTDEKTGLLNAASWRTAAEQAVTRDKVTDRHCGILMIDLDHFKRVNDTYGHVAGDLVLRSLAELLGDCTREHDLVGRFGGEEFAVLAARINQAEALRIAERIREAVKRLRVRVGPDVVITELSASIGVATAPNASTTVDALLERADQRLYLAKNGGRDRVVGLSEAS